LPYCPTSEPDPPALTFIDPIEPTDILPALLLPPADPSLEPSPDPTLPPINSGFFSCAYPLKIFANFSALGLGLDYTANSSI